MADVKISALPASTVPLAGTEVLPIVQGTTTKQVSIANVTAGRAVSAASLDLTTSPLPLASGGTGQSTVTTGDLLYGSAANTWSKLADVATGNALISGGVSTAPSWGKIGLTTHVSGTLPVANGGTNASSASITAFNNITGYAATGATGSTSSALVFATTPLIITPTINNLGSQVVNFNGYQSTVQNSAYQYDGRNRVATTSGTLTKFASVTIGNSTPCGRIIIDVVAVNDDANQGYAVARSQRVIVFSKYGGTIQILNSTEEFNQIGSVNAGVIAIAIVTSAAVNGNDIDLKATATATGAVGATNIALVSQVTVFTGSVSNTLTMV